MKECTVLETEIIKKRDYSFDVVAAILMIVVVFHHAGILVSGPYSVMHVFNFFMPWFFFKAGMFHKFDEKIGKMIKKSFFRLFIPLCFCLVTSAFLNLLKGNFPVFSLKGIIGFFLFANGVSWFVSALIIVRLLFTILPKEKTLIICYCAISFLLSDVINNNNMELWLLIKEIPMALFYYTLGFLMKDFHVEKYSAIILLALTYSLFILLIPSKVDMKMEYVMFGNFEIAVIGNIVGILLINAIAQKIEKYIPNFLIAIGKESLVYYILHIQILIVCSYFLHHLGFPAKLTGGGAALCVFLIIPFVIKILGLLKLNFLIGK